MGGMLRQIGNDLIDLMRIANEPGYAAVRSIVGADAPLGYDNTNLGMLGSDLAFIPETLGTGVGGAAVGGLALRGSRAAGTSFSHGISQSAAPWLPRTIFNGRVVPNAQHMAHDFNYFTKGGGLADKYNVVGRFLDRIPPVWRGLAGGGTAGAILGPGC